VVGSFRSCPLITAEGLAMREGAICGSDLDGEAARSHRRFPLRRPSEREAKAVSFAGLTRSAGLSGSWSPEPGDGSSGGSDV